MRSFFVIIGFILAGCSRSEHAVEQASVDALSPHIIPIRSIDPSDTSFSDLEPLRTILQNKKIVLLGEQSHGDGATFYAKTRLIRFLHEKMGFDLLAMESGMFECEEAGRLMAQGFSPLEAFRNSTFDVWTNSRQCVPLMNYVGSTYATDRPLRYTGFDLQLTGRYGRDSLSRFARRFLKTVAAVDTSDEWTLRMFDTLTTNPKRFVRMTDSVREPFYSGLRSLQQKISSDNAPEKGFWLQELKSKETFARFLWNVDWQNPDPAYVNLRDRQMAENLIWLSRVRYPKSKIIVWAASSHIARNRSEIRGRKHSDTSMIPMGHFLWQAMRESVYAVGFTTYDGVMGLRGRNKTVLAKAAPGTLEDLLHHTGMENGFVDFRKLPEGHWLRDTVRARPFGYSVMLARWPEMLDGMLFTSQMFASDEREDE